MDTSGLFKALSEADQIVMTELLRAGYESAMCLIKKKRNTERDTVISLLSSARRLVLYRLSGLYNAEQQQRAAATIQNLVDQVLEREPDNDDAQALLKELSGRNQMRRAA